MEQEVFGDFLGPQPDETASHEANDFRPYKYYYVRFIARGGFGATYKVKRSSDDAIFALKITPPTSDMELKLLDRASQHFGVPRLFDAALFRGRAQLQVMEYCDGGDLSHSIRIQSRMASPFTEEVVKSIVVQLALTLHHLHVKLRMLHRDIKASNVLLCHSGLVKLGDFGLSKSAQQASTFCGTLSHMAPEVVMRSVYDTKADIWSLGIVLYNVLTFEKPFSDTDDIETMKRRYAEAADDVRLIADFTKVKGTFSPDLIYLCEQMLRLDPQNRPSAADLLASPLLAPEVERFPALVMSSSSLPEEVRLSVLSSLVDDGFCAMETLPPSLQDALNRPTLQPLVLNSDAEYLSSPALGSPRSVIPTPCGQSSSSAVIFSTLAWKASGGKFRVRCMVLSPVHVILIDIDAQTAQRLAMDPREMAAAAAFSSTSTKLKLSALRDCVAQEPVAGPSPAGQGTVDAPEILYPLRFIRTDDKEWSISVASQEQQAQWVLELTKAREREARRQNAASRARVGDEPVTSVSL